MYAAPVGKKQLGRTAAVIAGVVALAAIGVLIAGGVRKDSDGGVEGGTEERREEYLASFGLQVDQTSSMAQVMVPEEFDERFTGYNEMLRAEGFDLEPLRGATVSKCTYTVTNRPELGDVRAVLLVSGDKIVGGHLLDVATGELYPLSAGTGGSGERDEDAAEETLLPAASEELAEPERADTDGEVPAGAFPSD